MYTFLPKFSKVEVYKGFYKKNYVENLGTYFCYMSKVESDVVKCIYVAFVN